jgi:alditol oxidase
MCQRRPPGSTVNGAWSGIEVRQQNWAGNHVYRARRVLEPGSTEELGDVVRGGRRLRPLGTRHSFNDLADTTGDLVSLRRLPRRLDVDRAAGTVTIDGGASYGDVCGPLHAAGFALHNLASLPHISVAGACATATHGSGVGNGSLATAVVAIELLRADGELETFALGDPDFDGAVVALGALGIVSALTLAVEPTYEMHQDVFESLPLGVAVNRFDEIVGSGTAVSLFTDWTAASFHQVWVKRRAPIGRAMEPPPPLAGVRRATVEHHPIPGLSPSACTPQLGEVGPWHERLPHFRLDHVPSAGAELQSEFFVAQPDAVPALEGLFAIRDQIAPVTFVSEIRTIAADRHWLSPAFDRDSVSIHFTWKPDWTLVQPVLREVERRLAPFAPRPHWGKLFTMPPDAVRTAWPERRRFVALATRLDPGGMFRNAFLDRYVFGE